MRRQRRRNGHVESVRNFVIFLLILQNCGQARTHEQQQQQQQPEQQSAQQQSKQQRQQKRDGLAKFEFTTAEQRADGADEAAALYAYNFAKIYKTLYTRGHASGAGRAVRAALWHAEQQGAQPRNRIVLITTKKPFRLAERLQQDLDEKLRRTTTVKPFKLLQQLEQDEPLVWQQPQKSNTTFHILEALQMEQAALLQQPHTVKPFHVVQQLQNELDAAAKQTTTIRPFRIVDQLVADAVQQPPAEQHKAAVQPGEATRAKDSQKRKRQRIRRRRKRIRKRRKRKRKRQKNKKKRKKRKGGKKKRKRKKKPKPHSGVGQPAHVIFANPTQQPHHYPHYVALSTARPALPSSPTPPPFSKMKFLLRHKSLFKKKKKEYLSHVGHVLYPFVKFVAFFTVLNPFTLGVFIFTLVSPAVFGFLGFVALSMLVKPFLHLVFGVKHNVDDIERQRWHAAKRAERLRLGLRPITIHKHYYQQKPLHSTPPRQLRPAVVNWRRQQDEQQQHNPLLPAQRVALAADDSFDYAIFDK